MPEGVQLIPALEFIAWIAMSKFDIFAYIAISSMMKRWWSISMPKGQEEMISNEKMWVSRFRNIIMKLFLINYPITLNALNDPCYHYIMANK